MISENLVKAIEREGRKKNFHIHSAGSEYDENGEVVFVIKLKRSGLDYLDKPIMNFIDRFKWRWENESIGLPGEMEPTKDGVRIVHKYMHGGDREESGLLRKLRSSILVYGPGWTFWEAFCDKFLLGPLWMKW